MKTPEKALFDLSLLNFFELLFWFRVWRGAMDDVISSRFLKMERERENEWLQFSSRAKKPGKAYMVNQPTLLIHIFLHALLYVPPKIFMFSM